jgi:bacteriorhodopsin
VASILTVLTYQTRKKKLSAYRESHLIIEPVEVHRRGPAGFTVKAQTWSNYMDNMITVTHGGSIKNYAPSTDWISSFFLVDWQLPYDIQLIKELCRSRYRLIFYIINAIGFCIIMYIFMQTNVYGEIHRDETYIHSAFFCLKSKQ